MDKSTNSIPGVPELKGALRQRRKVTRLNRRRYRECVSALKSIISDPKQSTERRLRSIEVLLSIFDRHDRSEAQKVYQARWQEKRAEAEGLEAEAHAKQTQAQAEGTVVKESVQEFVKRIHARAEANALEGLLTDDTAEGSDDGE